MFLVIAQSAISQTNFITTWQTSAANESITIPTTGSDYNYDVDWENDGTFDDIGVTGNATHSYITAGTYTVAIRGAFPQIYFNYAGDRKKIQSVEQWGTIAWRSMKNAFFGCERLVINATDLPDLSNVTDMTYMFYGCEVLNQDIGNWDVSNVTDMPYMFAKCTVFNQDIGGWDVSKVTDMSNMFYECTAFNQNIGNWDVGNVILMKSIFSSAKAFNKDIGSWDVSKVTDMAGMFSFCLDFNQNIGSWDVSNVNKMTAMFNWCKSFNGDIGAWNVSKVPNMGNMFFNAIAFNQDIGNWDVSNVTDMQFMFNLATAFNQDIGSWDVSNVSNMRNMFNKCYAFNQDIGNWNVGNVTNMREMFAFANTFNQNIGSWDVSKAVNMYYMLAGTTSFDQNLGSWNVSKVTDMGKMFNGSKLSTTNYDALLIGWNSLPSLRNNVPFDAGNSTYCNGASAKTGLATSHNWYITDDGLDCTGLSTENFDADTILVYPNPSSGKVFLKYNKAANLRIFNMLGKEVYKTILKTGLETQELNLSKLQSGVYFLKISDKNKVFSERLVLE